MTIMNRTAAIAREHFRIASIVLQLVFFFSVHNFKILQLLYH